MKIMIDTNILLDVLENRMPFAEDSSVIWKLCETGQAKGYISALSFANLIYIMRKELNSQQIRDVYEKLALFFIITDLKNSDVRKASEMQWDDFEDALQSVTAERVKADWIVTRNIRDFNDSRIPACLPEEIISRYRA